VRRRKEEKGTNVRLKAERYPTVTFTISHPIVCVADSGRRQLVVQPASAYPRFL